MLGRLPAFGWWSWRLSGFSALVAISFGWLLGLGTIVYDEFLGECSSTRKAVESWC